MRTIEDLPVGTTFTSVSGQYIILEKYDDDRVAVCKNLETGEEIAWDYNSQHPEYTRPSSKLKIGQPSIRVDDAGEPG